MSTRYPGGIIGGDPRNTDSTGIWTLNQINQSRAAGRWTGYEIERSLRFNDDDVSFLNFTPQAAPDNRNIWSLSFWAKRGIISDSAWTAIFEADNGTSSDSVSFYEDQFLLNYKSGTRSLTIPAIFRDPSAWYHIFISWNSNGSTLADILSVYVNGSAQTEFSGLFSGIINDNEIFNFGNTVEHTIGRRSSGDANPFDGYLADFYFIDGEELDEEQFGFFDRNTGQWRAKQYAGSYGTNGFYLPFTDYENKELVINGTFTSGTDNWTAIKNANISEVNGRLRVEQTTDGLGAAIQVIDVVPGKTYEVEFETYRVDHSGELKVYVYDGTAYESSSLGSLFLGSGDNDSSSEGSFFFTFTAVDSQVTLTLRGEGDGGAGTTDFDNISVRENTIKDFSGNGNDWTVNNVSPSDVLLDSPTNNFATLNPIDNPSNADISQGNLRLRATANNGSAQSTIQMPGTGKYYFEGFVEFLDVSTTYYVSINTPAGVQQYRAKGEIYTDGVVDDGYAVMVTGDIIGVAVDCDAKEVSFYHNNTLQKTTQSSAETFLNSPIRFYLPRTDDIWHGNFGQDSSFAGNKTAQGNTDENGRGDFYYTPPAGFLALSTTNLPDPEITVPGSYFNTVLYTGNDGTQSITGVGFQPDWVWLKVRTVADSHRLIDAVRGDDRALSSNLDVAEYSNSGRFVSFDTDGFTVSSDDNAYNGSSETYVAWNWKANGAGVTNSDGSITSTVSASPESGFSIMSYTGTGGVATIGHGLGVAPHMFIVKNRTQSSNWEVYHESLGNESRVELDNTNAEKTGISGWNSTSPSSTVITVNQGFSGNLSGNSHVAYCFHSVEGYSAFGSYTGNGSDDGPFVYTGFRPAFVMTRDTSGGNWTIIDTTRDPYNVPDANLQANSTVSEFSNIRYDILSNGLKLRRGASGDTNASGRTYIYMAFAEAPFKYSNPR